MAWGQGIAGWGEHQEMVVEAQGQVESRARAPMPPQSAAFAAARTTQVRPTRPAEEQEQRLRQAQWSSSIFRNTIEHGLRREQTSRPSPEGSRDTRLQDTSRRETELIGRVREAGLAIGYHYDYEIPFDARTVIEDLLFELTQRTNEVTHLQKKADNLQKRSKVRKREESEERECPPMKRREPSGRSESSRNTDTSTHELRARTEQWSLAGQEPMLARLAPPISTMPLRQAAPPAQVETTRPTLTPLSNPIRVETTWQSGPLMQNAPSAPRGKRGGRNRRNDQRMAEQRPATMINGRPYEAAIRVSPPGRLVPEPEIQQRPPTTTGQTPSPRGEDDEPKGHDEDDPYNFDMSNESDDGSTAFRDDRDLEEDMEVPQFWGVVRVGDWGGVRGRIGYERDNVLRNMLSPNAYYSRLTNRVFVGKLAWAARAAKSTKFIGYRTVAGRHAYDRTVRGIPMNPGEVKNC